MIKNLPIWKSSPFVRILIPFLGGIILSAYCQNLIPVLLIKILLILALGFCFFYNLFSIGAQYRLKIISGICIYTSVFCLGFIIHFHSILKNKSDWFGHFYNNGDYLLIKIEEPLLEKPASYKAVSSVLAIVNNKGESRITSGKIISYFRKDSSMPELKYGDLLFIKSDIQLIKHNQNPGSFNYALYCNRNGIYHQSFIRLNELTLTGLNRGSGVNKLLYEARERIIAVIQKNIKGKEAQGLAEALLIGYTYDLEKDLLQAYTNTGVVHVIAISGLHLGLIYVILAGICKRLPVKTYMRAIIVICGLWIFSGLAGGSPSVLRSAAMFTIIVAGELINRKTFSINSLAASALVLLCYSPSWLWDIGFQLSYAAVLGLICLSAPIYKSIMIYNPMLDYLWKMNSVTISATILTLPLTTYYFHQFPLIFMLTNSVIVPISSIILIALIILCSLTFIPFLASIAGAITGWMIFIMNYLVKFFNEIPMTILKGLQISLFQNLLLFVFIFLASSLLINKNKKLLLPALLVLLLISAERALNFYRAEKQNYFIVYHVNGGNAYEWVSGRNSVLIIDEKHFNNPDFHLYTLKPAHIKFRINNYKLAALPEKNNAFISLSGKEYENEILVVRGRINKNSLNHFITKNQVLVIDGSVPARDAQSIKNDKDLAGKEIFDVIREGAFVRNLQLN